MIAIIDYDAGNLRSVQKALEYLGAKCAVTSRREDLLSADHVILPGVGSFGDAMEKISQYELEDKIRETVSSGIPFLGICLGLQLLFASSEESPGVKGLGLLPGRIVRIPSASGLKIPHIGWNTLCMQGESRILKGIPEESCVYFVHSYYLQSDDPSIVKARTEYGAWMDICVEKDNLSACQFHPEKSGRVGLSILRNFLEVR